MSTHDIGQQAARRRSPAEEARTLVSTVTTAALATIGEDGAPWCGLVVYGPTRDGSPVLLVSTESEHGRNLLADPRASLAINDPRVPGDPLDRPRITLSGTVLRPQGQDYEDALDAHCAAVPGARLYAGWDDQLLCVLEVERVRWDGGFATTHALSSDEYRAAEPDPTAPNAAKIAAQLNSEQPDGLLAVAREFAGARGAVSAFCTGIDRYGIDLSCTGAGQAAAARALFDEPLQAAAELRPAALELVRRARAAGAA